MNASLERRYIQVAGLPLNAETEQALKNCMDVDRAHIVESTDRVLLADRDGKPIGCIDFTPEYMAKVRAAAERGDQGAEPDPKNGDTVVRKLDAAEGRQPGEFTILSDDREVPPIDLPDYQPDEDDEPARSVQRIEVTPGIVLGFLLLAVMLGAILAAQIIGG